MPNVTFVPTQDRKIHLTGEPGRLEVTFLGVGAAFANTMFQSNIFLVKGRTHVMIDLGSKASVALYGTGLSVLDVENLVVTHSHADHVGGIEEWCLKARYAAPLIRKCARGEYKPNLLTTEEYAHILWDATLRGGLEHSEGSRPGQLMSLSDYVNLVYGGRVDGYGRRVYGLSVGEGADAIDLKLMRTNHVPDNSAGWQTAFYSVGVLVDDRVFITGDTMFDLDLVEEFGARADVIFHDCQELKGGVHASYEELCGLPSQLRAKTILYHLTDNVRDKFAPEKDGFAGWARCYREGKYVF
jgi:ribonuclease BN (tRNA processing enzyme)